MHSARILGSLDQWCTSRRYRGYELSWGTLFAQLIAAKALRCELLQIWNPFDAKQKNFTDRLVEADSCRVAWGNYKTYQQIQKNQTCTWGSWWISFHIISIHFISFPHVLIPDHSLQSVQADVANRPLYVLHELQHTSASIFAQPALGGRFDEDLVIKKGSLLWPLSRDGWDGRSRSGCRYGNGPQPHNIPQCILDILDYFMISDGFGMIWCDVAFGCICIWSPLCPNQRAHETWKNVRLCRPFSGALGARCLWEDLADPNLHTIHSLHQPVFIHASWTAPSWREDHSQFAAGWCESVLFITVRYC